MKYISLLGVNNECSMAFFPRDPTTSFVDKNKHTSTHIIGLGPVQSKKDTHCRDS